MNRSTIKKTIAAIVSMLLLLTPIIASSQDLLENDKSLSHRIVPYHEEVEVGTHAKFELTVSNTYNPDAKESTLTVVLPSLINDGSVVFVSDVSTLAIYGVTPTLVNNMLVYNFDVINEAFAESVVLDFSTVNGLSVNNQALSITSTLEQGDTVEIDEATSLLKASWNLTTTNEFLGTKETSDGSLEEREDLILGDYAVYGVGAMVEKLQSGTLALNHNEPVSLRYIIPKGAVYVSNTLGIDPVIESADAEQTVLLWTLDSAAFETDADYFSIDFQITLHVEDPNHTIANYDHYETTLRADANYLDLQTNSSSAQSISMVVKKDGSTPQPSNGSRYLPGFGGPSDSQGNTGSIGTNNDISVTDSAELGWLFFTTPQSATHPYTALEGYDVFFAPSDNQRIESFYTGDYFYRPNTGVGRKELLENVYMSFSVLYKNENTWTNLVETLNESTNYTAQELGIDPSKDIDLVWVAFHTNKPEDVKFPSQVGSSLDGSYERGKIPAGLTTGSMKFKTSITDGYVGDLSGRYGQVISGFNTQNSKINQHTLTLKEFIEDGRLPAHPSLELGANLEGYLSPMTAKVVTPTEGDSRVIQAEVKFQNAISGVVDSGSNRIKVSIKSDELSLRTIKGPFDIQMLLPEGVILDESKDLENAIIKDVVTNYKGTKRDLLTLTFTSNQALPAGRIISMYVPVIVDEKAPYELETIVTGSLSDDFVVSDNANDIGYITQKVSDPFDESANPKEVYMIRNITSYKFAYSHYIVASALDFKTNTFKQNVNISEDDEIVSKLSIINNKGTNTKHIDLVYTLPHINDSFAISGKERNSTVNLQLSNFVDMSTMPQFEIFYTYEHEITENTEWFTENDISDLSLVKSFRISKQEDSSGINDHEISFEIRMMAPNQDVFGEVPVIQAVQSFTAKIDDNDLIESAPSYITTKKGEIIPEEPEEPKEPEVEKPKVPDTGLESTANSIFLFYMLVMVAGTSYIVNQFGKRYR